MDALSAVVHALQTDHPKVWMVVSDSAGTRLSQRAVGKHLRLTFGAVGTASGLSAAACAPDCPDCDCTSSDTAPSSACVCVLHQGRALLWLLAKRATSVTRKRWGLLRRALTGQSSTDGSGSASASASASSSAAPASIDSASRTVAPSFGFIEESVDAADAGRRCHTWVGPVVAAPPSEPAVSSAGAGSSTTPSSTTPPTIAVFTRQQPRSKGKVDLATLVSHRDGVDNTGNVCVWPSEEVLAAVCLARSKMLTDKVVFETAAGSTGLAGLLVAVSCRASRVIITDGNRDAAENLQRCVDANTIPPSTSVTSALFLWGSDPVLPPSSPSSSSSSSSSLSNQVDVLIGADCLFFEDYHTALLASTASLLAPAGQAWYLAPRRGGSLDRFVARARAYVGEDGVPPLFDVAVEEDYLPAVSAKRDELMTAAPTGAAFDPDVHYPLLVTVARRPASPSPAPPLTARVEFTQGYLPVVAQPFPTNDHFQLGVHGFQVVRGAPDLVACATAFAAMSVADRTAVSDAAVSQATTPSHFVSALQSAGQAVLQSVDSDWLARAGCADPAAAATWELGNVIFRLQRQFASTAHRDLDGHAVGNLKRRGGAVFYNMWLALAPVEAQPLGLVLPSTVRESDAGPFKGLAGDRTGLTHHPRHQWVYAPAMQAGDALVWRSDVVFHSALLDADAGADTNTSGPARQSVDIRFVVTPPSPSPPPTVAGAK